MKASRMLGVGCLLVVAGNNVLLAQDHAINASGARWTREHSSARFVENLGQWPASIRFLAEFDGARVRAECDAIGIEGFETRSGSAIGTYWRLRFEGAEPASAIEGLEPRPGIYSYFLGNDPALWRSGARAYAKLRWRDLYPGIDLVLRRGGSGIEYDLLVAPGAQLDAIALRCEGVDAVDEVGREVVALRGGLAELLHVPGRCFETRADGVARELACLWSQDAQGLLRVSVPDRDPALALVIDPELLWSTYLGGVSHEGSSSVAWDEQGNLTVTGRTQAFGFPQTPGTFQSAQQQSNVFVTRFTGSGELLFSSVFGGSGGTTFTDVGDVAVGTEGDTVVVGHTGSASFPVTPGAFDTVKNSIVPAGFVTRLGANGDRLLYSTYLEGTHNQQSGAQVLRVALDSTGRAIVAGAGVYEDFPVTAGAFQTTHGSAGSWNDCFVARLASCGDALEWSTFLGGNFAEGVTGVVVDEQDRITVGGITSSTNFPTTPGALKTSLGSASQNAFVCRLDPDGSNMLWSTYLGGTSLGRDDNAQGVAVTDSGDAVVVGYTDSPTYPVTPGAFQTQFQFQGPVLGFVTRIQDGGAAILASTFLVDTAGWGTCVDVAVDPSGVVTASGAGSCQSPVTIGAWDTLCGGTPDSMIRRLSPNFDRLFYSSFIGGQGEDSATSLSMTKTGRVALAGQSWVTSQNWPITADAYQPNYGGGANDAVVTVLDLLLQGVRQTGASIPSCKGPLVANATKMPRAGTPSFSLYCSGAPPSASGVLLLAYASPLLQPTGGASAGLHPLIAILPATSNEEGFVETALPLTGALAGTRFSARFLFPRTSDCHGPAHVSASNGLVITVQ